jgi:nucleoside-diphosphate-sugar epimerase
MYAATKAAADRLARTAQATLPLTIVYPAAVQGPHDPTFSIGPQLVAAALTNGRVLVTEGGLPTTDVRDLARLVASLFELSEPPDRIMAPSFFMRHDDYHRLLQTLTGRVLPAQRVPGWLLRAMGHLGDLAARFGRPTQLTSEAAQVLTRSVPVDDRDACRLLGREKVNDNASFRDLIEWMVGAGYLDSADAGLVVTGAANPTERT